MILTKKEQKLIIWALKAYRGDFFSGVYPNDKCPVCQKKDSFWSDEITDLLSKVEYATINVS
jgi:hypothetical protein